MIIDSHGHACCQYLTVEKIRETLAETGIDRVVLFPAEAGKDRTDKIPDTKKKNILYISNIIGEFLARFMKLSPKIHFANTYVYYLKQLSDGLVYQFYQPTPSYLAHLEKDYNLMRFDGIKLHQCVEYFPIHSPFFAAVLDLAEKHNLPIVIHLCARRDALDLIELLKNTKRNVKIIIAHMLFYRDFAEHWETLREHIFFDCSNYYFISRVVLEDALKLFGAGKIIFGSDNPFGEKAIEKTIGMVENLPLDRAEKDAVLGGNIARLLGLELKAGVKLR